MKILTPIIFLIFSLKGFSQFQQSYIAQEFNNSGNGALYLAPINDIYSSLLHTGVFPRYSEKGFHIKIGIHATRMNITDNMKVYRGKSEGMNEDVFIDAPSILGDEMAVMIEDELGNNYIFPGGQNIENITLAAPELYIGTLLGTDFYGRYALAPLTGDLGRIKFYGGGIRHDFGRYFLPEYVKWYLSYNYHELKIGNTINSFNQYALTQLGVKLNRIGIYGLFGYELNEMNISHDFEDISFQDIDIDIMETYPYRFGGGLNLSFKYFEIYSEYNMNDPVNIILGVSVGI
jgi:hypothetical protein